MSMPPQMQAMQQQHAAIKSNAHQLLNQLKNAAPHSQLTRTMENHVRHLEGMIAQGKNTASLDAHMKQMHQELQSAQKQAYNQHNLPSESHFGPAQMGQPGHFGSTPQQGQYGYANSQMGHYGYGQTSMASHLPAQPAGPSAHSIGNADYVLRNMSKGLHSGNAKF